MLPPLPLLDLLLLLLLKSKHRQLVPVHFHLRVCRHLVLLSRCLYRNFYVHGVITPLRKIISWSEIGRVVMRTVSGALGQHLAELGVRVLEAFAAHLFVRLQHYLELGALLSNFNHILGGVH